MTDLSKAFYCLPHRLIVSKLNAYGLHLHAHGNYFTDGKQRVKMGLQRRFKNNFMYMVSDICDIYNYADDNRIVCQSDGIPHLHLTMKLQRSIEVLLNCHESNYMQANPNNFQFTIF